MRCTVLSVGQKLPQWCNALCDLYLTRLSRFLQCTLIEIPAASRTKKAPGEHYQLIESTKILEKISPSDTVIALSITGKSYSTEQFSQKLSQWQLEGKNLVFVIGGPDGLAPACLARANYQLSLSALTFPHTLARVLLLEQLYRVSSLLANHPYHRE